eukprot:COSAG02_NODE_2741_length_8123_cov_5.360793_6_plen_219_part_00
MIFTCILASVVCCLFLPQSRSSSLSHEAPAWIGVRTNREHVFNVVGFGAVGDGVTKDTKAVEKAVAAVKEAGAGTVYFPSGGRFLVAPFNLTSHCTVYIDAGASLVASPVPSDWPLIPALPSYGVAKHGGQLRHTSLIHGEDLKDVIITGANGTIDGQGSIWWHKRPDGYTPGHLIEIMRSTDVELSNLTLVNSPVGTTASSSLCNPNCSRLHGHLRW